jgi:hypothetical protein
MSLEERDASWRFLSGPPGRYTMNYQFYQALGGTVKPVDDMLRFSPEGHSGDSARFWFFCLVLDQLMKEGMQGDIAEVGVYQGRTAALLATIAQRLGRTAYLFDTFEGFSDADIKGMDAARLNTFTDTSLEAVRAYVGEEATRYVKGYFPESASQIPHDLSFCLVHIDCDLYSPIRSSLEYFYPRMVPGGFIVVHDYSGLGWPGAERAIDEFFSDKPESTIPLPDVGGSMVIRKAKAAGGGNNWRTHRIRSVLGEEWASAGRNAFGELLGAGWSGPEPWGVWGLGQTHELDIAQFPGGDFVLEAEVWAHMPGPTDTQEVEVVVGGLHVATWQFSGSDARGIRTAAIPKLGTVTTTNLDNLSLTRVQFRLKTQHPNPGGRALGLALVRMRLTEAKG